MEQDNKTNTQRFINSFRKRAVQKKPSTSQFLFSERPDYRKVVSKYDSDEVREIKYQRGNLQR